MTSFDGTVRVLWDTDGDSRSDQTAVFADGFIIPLGITIHPQNGDVYVSSNGRKRPSLSSSPIPQPTAWYFMAATDFRHLTSNQPT